MTSSDIIIALREKTAGEAFFSGPKLGPSYGASGRLRIMDAVSLRKSWTRPCISGYEIKVSRSDFTRDDKWPDYLESCNRFFWVCPKDLIKLTEIDDRCGLIYVAEKGAYTRKAALHRQIEMPEGLLYYLIMWRLDEKEFEGRSSERVAWQQWIDGKIADKELGYRVQSALATKLTSVTSDLEALREHNKQVDDVLDQFDITQLWQLERRLWRTTDVDVTALREHVAGMARILKEAGPKVEAETKA